MTSPATLYALAVVEGREMAGPHVRDSAARHLRDLENGHERGLYFDDAAGNRAVAFFRDVLCLNGGEHEGKPFVLLPWQAFIVCSLFGWMNADGTRRFRMAFVLTGKGSGKSPLAAGIGHYCLVADKEPGAEVYAAASKRDQAMVLFRDAVSMVKQSPALSSRLTMSGGDGKEYNIAYLAASAFFRVIAAGDGQSGPRPHCVLLDEIHEHHDDTVVEMLRAGTKGRRQALIFGITNAEASRVSVCANYREYAAKVASGLLIDDAFFCYVAALDVNDDPFKDMACWGKANPSLGHTFTSRYLEEQVTQARGMPSKEAIVRRLNFCQPTDAATPWVDRDLWEACETEFDPADLAGLPCYGGLDLSSKRDLTALAVVWRHPDGKLSAAVWFWLPGDTLAEQGRRDNVPYLTWRDQGHLQPAPGRIIDKGHIVRFLAGFSRTQDMRALAYDQAQIDDFEKACDEQGYEAWVDGRKPDETGSYVDPPGQGLRMRRHGQGFQGFQSQTTLWMPRSISELEEAVVKRSISIRINPVLRWNSASAVLQGDATGNRKWEKRKSTGRIDGMVALTMAVGAATSDDVGSDQLGFLANPIGM